MKPITRVARLAVLAGMCLSSGAGLGAEPPRNLIVNGGFEAGSEGWRWGEGLPEPGFVDREGPYKGKASFVMGLTGVEDTRRMMTTVPIDPAMDYELSLTLRGSDLAEESVQIALLEWGTEKGEPERPQGWVWVPDRRGARNLIVTGGSFDWREFTVHLYRQGIKPSTKRVTLYIDRTSISQGELGIDEVSLVPREPVEYRKPGAPETKPLLPAKATASSPADQLRPPVQKPVPDKEEGKPPPDPAAAGFLLLDRGDSLGRWSLNLGSEFPGAAGELSVEEANERRVLEVAYDFSEGGRYAGAQCQVEIRQADALAFDLRGPGRRYFIARVKDATGQTHSGGFHTTGSSWETIELPLNQAAFSSHWGGADDGVMHFPLREVLIAASSPSGVRGEFQLRDLAVKTRDRGETWRIEIATEQPGQIHLPDDPRICLTVTVENRLRSARAAPLSVEVFDLDRKPIASHQVEHLVGAWQRQTIELSIQPPGPGYYPVLVKAGGETAEGAFGVVPRPRRFRQRDADSFFAMHVSDPEVAARLGVHFSRHFHFWRYTESQAGQYKHAIDYVDACLAAGIDVMMCLDYREPGWLKPPTRENGLPTGDALRRYADWVRDAVRAHPGVAVFEIQNEPDLGLGRSRNLPSKTGVEFYSQLVEIAAPIIRQEAPHARIAGCSVSGGDYEDGFTFSRPVLERAGRFLDIFGAHPYASPRIFGPGLQPSWPGDNREAEKHRAALDLLNQFKPAPKMWVGEKGWAIAETSPLAEDAALSFAHCLAQSLVVARSTPGIEKYFWFLQRQRFGSEGGDYTLFRGDLSLQPMPAAVAYANVAWHLDHCRPVASLALAGDARVSAFERLDGGGAVAVLWSVDQPFLLEPRFSGEVEAFDLFGRGLAAESLSLTSAPLFVAAKSMDASALIASICAAGLKPGKPFDVVSAAPSDVNTLNVRLVNRTLSTFPILCRFGDRSKRLILPGVSEPVQAGIHLGEPLTALDPANPLELTLAAPGGEAEVIRIGTDLLPVERRAGIVVDGDGSDWQGVPAVLAETRGHLEPPDPAGWRGAEDLSARASLSWDNDHLYLLIRVLDDTQVADPSLDLRDGDCLHVALDLRNDAGPRCGYDENDREYRVALGRQGTRVVRTHPGGPGDSSRAVAKRSGGATVYEMAFPWSSLGRAPRPGLVFSFNFAAVENDGSGRKYALVLSPGMAGTQRPGLFRDVFLTD